MAIETIITAGVFAGFVAFIAHRITKTEDSKEFQEYRSDVSNDFLHITDLIYSKYGKWVKEEIPEYTNEDGDVVPAHTEERLILEDKEIAAALVTFQTNLYRR